MSSTSSEYRENKPVIGVKLTRAKSAKTRSTHDTVSNHQQRESSRPKTAVPSQSPRNDGTTVKKIYEARHTSSSRHGEHVVARCDVDGFYYAGIIISSLEVDHLVVEFEAAPLQRIKTRPELVVPMSGAIARPRIHQGDHVLVLVRALSGFPRKHSYQPGLVVGCPSNFQINDPKLYAIVLFDQRSVTAFRSQMIRITEHKYKSTVGYINEQIRIANADYGRKVASLRPMSSTKMPHYSPVKTVQIEDRIKKMFEENPLSFSSSQSISERKAKMVAAIAAAKKREAKSARPRKSAPLLQQILSDYGNDEQKSPQTTRRRPKTASGVLSRSPGKLVISQ